MQIPIDDLYPKDWDVFEREDAPAMDFVFSVCDKTLDQTCPTWPGHPVTAHWGIDDPSQVEGDDATRQQAFRKAFYTMRSRIHPFAAELLTSMQIPIDDLRPKDWNVFEREDAPTMDFVFSVCDKTRDQTCPTWPGHPVTAHWGIDEPSQVEGDDATRQQAFRKAFYAMRSRIQLFDNLPIASLDRLSLQSEVDSIGRLETTDSNETNA